MATLTRDGVKLVFEESGVATAPGLVFVHGWTCDRSHFAPQVEHFSERFRCVSLDLRGHGESDAPEQDYTMTGFADDIAWMCGQLGITRATFVGHSMGGAIVLALADARPDLVRAIALLDPAILFPADLLVAVRQLGEAFRAPSGMEVVRQFESDRFFLPTSDDRLKAQVIDAACRTPQHVVTAAFESMAAFDAESALKDLRAPLLYVGAEPQIVEIARLKVLCPEAMIGNTVGAGHFHQLEVPDQVNAMLSRFLAITHAA